MSNNKRILVRVFATLTDYIERTTHWREGGATRHDAKLALNAVGNILDDIEWTEKGISEWRDVAQTNARQGEAARATSRVAIAHLQAVLNQSRTHAEQQAADTAARDWLISIGSEPGAPTKYQKIMNTTNQLPEPDLGYIKTDKSNQPAFSARQMREMKDTNQLPPLPVCTHCAPYPGAKEDFLYTADQMRAYALQARAQVQGEQPDSPWTENVAVKLEPSRTGRVYIAGPMTGIAEFNFPAFNKEAVRLRAEGLTVLNPADHGIVEGAEWADYLRHDIAGLATCQRIHLLSGWEKSKGARLEVTIAHALGIAITLSDGAASPDSTATQADVTDEQVLALAHSYADAKLMRYGALGIKEPPDPSAAFIELRRAILSLRPEKVPMTNEELKAARLRVCDDPNELPEPWAFRMGVYAAEAHHGITAQAKKETP